ncbi:translocation/assembly module TamB domain-containing protein, partial [Sphingomonas bacterium]|uniref:translocation/assembly module TamB domain-containing protein n=1 Tax=Sphingomonas bacterium TaxID=1895847 RepID=UPI001576FF52
GYGGGSATIGGRFGDGPTALDLALDRLPLGLADIVAPRLGLAGAASGHASFQSSPDAAPTGRADLTIRGLTRSGLVLASQPIDLGLNAALTQNGLAMRAIAALQGRTIGRAQARIAPLSPDPNIADRLGRAPLFAQLRYAGPGNTLWRLIGVQTIDLSGPLSVAADVGGTLDAPLIRGTLTTTAGKLESSSTGTVIQNIRASGRFDGSRLVLDTMAGTTAGGGSVSGRGAFDFSGSKGVGIDIALQAQNAQLLNRDDIAAAVTGPLTIRSDGIGGTVAGDLALSQGRYRLGSAAAAQVARLNVVDLNRSDDEAVEDSAPVKPWNLDIKARAFSRLMVTGLGLDSEWRATLTIKGAVDNPAIGGKADLIRGNYQFAGRRFDLSRGVIRFSGSAPPDPILDITAGANLQGLNASIRVTGTGLRPEISFESVPALPEDELLSRLLFGTSITNLSAPEALQLATAVASLRSSGGGGLNLDPINAVRKAVHLDRLRIVPADITTGQKTSIAAGKYIGRRTYVELITDGAGYSATSVEFRITRWLSLLSTISTIGRQSANVRISKDY